MNKWRKIKYLICALSALIVTMTGSAISAVSGASAASGEPIRLAYDLIGHYALNYTGNTNSYQYWDESGTKKLVDNVYKDRSDIPVNNSSATLTASDSKSMIKRAYLVWETRAEEGITKPVVFYTPSGASRSVRADMSCKDTRTNSSGQTYSAVYTMAADVTSIVNSQYGGYGTYTVANIPVWPGASGGVACGGESVASWQLVVIEESPGFPVRTVSLNIMSQYYDHKDFSVSVDLSALTRPTGDVSLQMVYGETNTSPANTSVYDLFGNGEHYADGHPYTYKINCRGLYKNGVCFNGRDQGERGSYPNGSILMHMGSGGYSNNATGFTFNKNYSNTEAGIFLFGAAVDILQYDIQFNPNGGTGTMPDMPCIYGREADLPENQYSREGYIFAGWNTKPDGSGEQYEDKASVYNLTDKEEKVTLYAQWTVVYKITLDDQDADAAGTAVYYEAYGLGNYTTAACTAPISKIRTPSKENYVFDGYYTGRSGTGKQCVDAKGNILSTPTTFEKDTTLYAKWKPLAYHITLDSQNATAYGTEHYFEWYSIGNYTTELCTTPIDTIKLPEKTGYVFEGYYTGKNGSGTRYVDAEGNILSTPTTFRKDTTLYAKWAPGIYRITLDHQGADTAGTALYYEKFGVGNFTTAACTVSISRISKPAKSHYSFHGYYTGTNGTGQRIIDPDGNIAPVYTMFTKDTTLYACWEPDIYTVTLDSQGAENTGSRAYYEKYGVANYTEYNTVNTASGTVAQTYEYTGSVQTFIAPYTGTYTLKTWGAQGGGAEYNSRGKGGYSTGTVWLNEGDILYIYVGGEGNLNGGYNGGGSGGYSAGFGTSADIYYYGGGGATDIRKGGIGLADRIIVAGGGGGGTHWTPVDNSYAGGGNYVVAEGGAGGGSDMTNPQCFTYRPTFSGEAGEYSWMTLEDILPAGQTGTNILSDNVNIGEAITAINGNSSCYHIASSGGLGYGGVNCGGGYYGGTLYQFYNSAVDAVHVILPYGTVKYKYYGGFGGSGYIGGVSDGSMSNGARSGNGRAQIIYNEYSPTVIPSTSITVPKKTGYAFGGYYTGTDGTGTQYVDDGGNILSSPTTFTADVTLYAKWTASGSDTYRIAFNGNGADKGTMPIMTCSFHTNYTLTANTFTKAGYTFAGWARTPDGEKVYDDRAAVNNLATVKGDVVTLYAKWTANSYTIIFDPNGGTGHVDGITAAYDEEIILPDGAAAYKKYTRDNENVTADVLNGTLVPAGETGADNETKAYESVFLGWAFEDGKDLFEPQHVIGETVSSLAEEDGAAVTLYAVWDDCPWIHAEDLYFSLEQAQSGYITYDLLMDYAEAEDREDGSPILPGEHENGTSFKMTNYAPTDFTQFNASGASSETYQVVDSAGSVYRKTIMVHVVDTTPIPVEQVGTVRFINEYYYDQPYENGGLEDDSVWKTDPDYAAVLKRAFDNLKNDAPEMQFVFTHEDILEMKEFVRVNGTGKTKYEDALERFYDQFLAPNRTV